MRKKILLATLTALYLPQIAFADVITPLSTVTYPLIPIIILIEAIVFWLLSNKLFKVQINIWKTLLITIVANLATSLLGTFIPLYKYVIGNIIWLGIAFVLSVFIEWAIYLLFLKKVQIKKMDLLKISLIANLITYAMLVIFQLI